MKKRAQMEIFGFLVIVILLVVVGVIYLKFAMTPSEDVLSEARTNIEVSNFLSSIMAYTPCPGNSLEDAVKNCENNGQTCGQDACNLLENELLSALNAYNSAVWGGKYDGYTLNIELSEPISIMQGDCFNTVLADSYKISTSGGLIQVYMQLCY
ncbi:MAG: hypothetical protein ABIF40_05335 [archaeon]